MADLFKNSCDVYILQNILTLNGDALNGEMNVGWQKC